MILRLSEQQEKSMTVSQADAIRGSLIADLEPEYARTVGAAVFAFAMLEMTAVRGCEALRPGIMAELEDCTAGRVADILLSLCRQSAGDTGQLTDAAQRFTGLVRSRNNLLHAQPGRGADGAPRLLRTGDAWSLDEITAIAGAFAACEQAMSAALSGIALPES